MLHQLDIDLLIIGGGILGTVIAMQAAETGHRVVLLRLMDRERPEAETLRNQAWLQSGLLFGGKVDSDGEISLPQRTWLAARRLEVEFGLRRSSSGGIIRFPEEDPRLIESFLGTVSRLHLEHLVDELAPEAARRELNWFYLPKSKHYRVPDRPFPEAEILGKARRRALAEGAVLWELDTPAVLLPAEVPGGCAVKLSEDCRLTAPRILLAAGAGNLPLLDQLGASTSLPRLTVKRTPLLVLRQTDLLFAPLFVNPAEKFAVTRQPSGRLVAAFSQFGAVTDADLRSRQRRCAPEEQQKLLDKLPDPLRHLDMSWRFTAGYEPMQSEPRVHKEAPIVHPVPDHPGVVVAFPGRATLSMDAADKALQALALPPPLEERHPPILMPAGLPGASWEGPIRMHYAPEWDSLNEV